MTNKIRQRKDIPKELAINLTGEQTAAQNEKWKLLSEKLFKMPAGELSDYADWLDEFSPPELIQYCQNPKFREFFEFWDKPRFDRIIKGSNG